MPDNPYTTGGTVQAQEGGLYLVRPADQQLLKLCRASRFAYVLTPRQLGKSSLMFRTAAELLAEGYRAVMVDLTQIGTHSNAEIWYGDVLEVVADQLELPTNARAWWNQESDTGLTLRLSRFFEEVVLAEVSEPIVIFVDEIDTTLSLAFTDDFFAAIRYFYVARAQKPALRRLSFVLIGVATPADLIRDPKRTPFNIGERVDLLDFTPQEAAPLAAGLPLPPEQAQRALGWILGWTGGHPYLSQRLCNVLASDPPADWSEAVVDKAVGRTFFGEHIEQDNNLQFVRDMLTKRAPQDYGAELLRTYRTIWRGKRPVADEEQNLVHAHLKLAGVVRRDGRHLVMRNRIYQAVFNAAWIEEHNPEDFWKRYGPVLKWALPVSVSAVMVAGVMTALALEARRQAEIANLREQAARVMYQLSTVEAAPGLVRALDAWTRSLGIPEVWSTNASALEQAWLSTQETNLLLGHESGVTGVTYSPDGRLIISSSGDGTLRLWDAKSGAAIGAPLKGHQSSVMSVVFSPDGHMIASGGIDSTVRLWDARKGAGIGIPLRGNEGMVRAVAFSADSRLIASGGDDGTVRLWDAKSGAAIGPPLKGHESEVNSVAFSPDGRLLASGGGDRTVRLWDAKSGTAIGAPLKGHESWVMSVVFSPDGHLIASGGGEGTVRLWNAKSGAEVAPPLKGQQGLIRTLAFSTDSRIIASGGGDGTVRLWDANSGAPIGPPLRGHEGEVNSVAFSPDGRQIASGGGEGMVRLWNSKSGAAVGAPLKGHEEWVGSVVFSPDGRMIASGGGEGTVRLWDRKSGAAIGRPLIGRVSGVSSVAFSPDGRLIAIGFDDYLELIDWRSDKVIAILYHPMNAGHINGKISVAFSPNGRLIASGGSDRTVRIWNAKSGAAIGAPLKGHGGGVWSVAFSPDGNLIASGSEDRTVQIWDWRRGTAMGAPLKGHEGEVSSVAFSPDGRMIASGSRDRTVRLWDASSGSLFGSPLKGHEGGVWSVAFSPDGRMIASGGGDKLIRIWDAKNGAAIGTPFKGHEGGVWSVAFSSDGSLIASGSADRTVRRWVASPQDWFRLACARMAHHPLLVNPASATSDTELIAAGKRANQSCQAANSRAARAQHRGTNQGLAGLLTWARRLLT